MSETLVSDGGRVSSADRYGDHSALLAFAAEHMHMAAITADLASRSAEIGDSAALDYFVRRTAAYLRAIVPIARELRHGRGDGGLG